MLEDANNKVGLGRNYSKWRCHLRTAHPGAHTLTLPYLPLPPYSSLWPDRCSLLGFPRFQSITGFSRLEEGLRRAAPPLTRALREELHVLNGVAEPHAILGFLNGAYLGTVARELEAAMERECETALKDNTAPRSKAGRISARAKASVGQ